MYHKDFRSNVNEYMHVLFCLNVCFLFKLIIISFIYHYFLLHRSKFNYHDNHDLVVKGDSWFGLVKAAAALAEKDIQAVLQIKTGYSLFPKDFIDEKLKGYPGGVHIVLKGKHPNGKTLLAIGYRYSKSRTLFFVSTDKAGSTVAGTNYENKYVDKYGNVGMYNKYFIIFIIYGY